MLLLSHFDVVDTADYGEFKHMACKVPELMDVLNDKRTFCLNGSEVTWKAASGCLEGEAWT